MSDPNSYINEGFHSSLGFVWKERHYLMTFWKIFQTKGSLWRSDRIKSELPCGAVSDRKQHYLLFAQVLFVCLPAIFILYQSLKFPFKEPVFRSMFTRVHPGRTSRSSIHLIKPV